MEKSTFKKEVQRLIGEAETEQALNLMLSFFGKNPSYLNLYNTTLQAKSLLNRTEKDEKQGVISVETAKITYNQVTRQILDLLQMLDKETHGEASPLTSNFRKRAPLFGIALLAILAVVGVVLYRTGAISIPGASNTNQGQVDGPANGPSCPEFPLDTNLNVLVLPFKDLKGTKEKPLNNRLARLIELRLDEFKRRYSVNFDLGVQDDLTLDLFPTQISQAEAIARNCQAQLIIWGTTEKISEEQEIIITRYSFLNTERIKLHKLILISDTDIDTVTTQSSIITNGSLTENIEKTLKYIFGILAHETGNPDAVIASLSDLELSSDSASFTRDVLLTDAYIVKNDEKMVKEKTEKLNSTHPQYLWAQNNKGVIAYREGDFDEAYQRFVVAEHLSDSSNRQPIERGKSMALKRTMGVAPQPSRPERSDTTKKTEAGGTESPRKKIGGGKQEEEQPANTGQLSIAELKELLKRKPRYVAAWKRLTTRVSQLPTDEQQKEFEKIASLAKELGVSDLYYSSSPIAQWYKLLKENNEIQ